MARHNREGKGQDQLGRTYAIRYQPDWLWRIKVTVKKPEGGSSTRILFRNTGFPQEPVRGTVRTSIRCRELGLNLDVSVDAGDGRADGMTGTWKGRGKGRGTELVFSLIPLPDRSAT